MATETSSNQVNSPAVQHDSDTSLPKKPSFLYIVSISLGVLTILVLTASAYYGMAR